MSNDKFDIDKFMDNTLIRERAKVKRPERQEEETPTQKINRTRRVDPSYHIQIGQRRTTR